MIRRYRKMKRKVIPVLVLCAAMLIPAVPADAKKLSSSNAAAKAARSEVPGATVTEVDTDRESGYLVYEVSLVKGKKEYDLKYRASNAQLITYEWDLFQHYNWSGGKHISKKKIRKKALNKVSGATVKSIYLEYDDDGDEYKVLLKKGKKNYTLEYDAGNGKLISYKWKLTNAAASSSGSSSGSTSSNSGIISEAEAKKIAAAQAPDTAEFVKVHLEYDDGRQVYEIEMRDGDGYPYTEYEFTIDAKTGKILESDVDVDD